MKCCRVCRVELGDHNWFPSYQKSYSYECKTCAAEKNRKNRSKRGKDWLAYRRDYEKNRTKQNRDYNLRKNYNISSEEWSILFEQQGSCCKICKTTSPPSMGWHTDHCHKTNNIRGILCHSCNTGLGKFKDDPNLLAEAIEYLKRNSTDLV